MSSVALFQPITIGDQRPVAVDVTPSDDAAVTSASFAIVRRNDPADYVWQTGSCTVDVLNGAFRLTTSSLVSFPTVDLYTVQYTITWNDGQVDNTVAAVIPVEPLRR